MGRIEPKDIRYIKLGAGGAWEGPSLDENRLYWGDRVDPHEIALSGDWEAARKIYVDQGSAPGTATGYVRQLRDFYTLGPDCLWITFARGQLWWAFADPGVIMLDAPLADGRTRYRNTTGPWQNRNVNGEPLVMADLSSRLTQLAGYRQTMCSVKASDYLLRRINGEIDPLIEQVEASRAELVDAVALLVGQLHWSDFEIFVDLLLGRIGWRRVSQLGGTLKDVDLVVSLPATGERADVQVKSAANQSTVDTCYDAFALSGAADRFIFACHSPKGEVVITSDRHPCMELWDPARLADRAVGEGLIDWLVAHAG